MNSPIKNLGITKDHPVVLGFLVAVIFSLLISSRYLMLDGIKLYFAGRRWNEDILSALPFIVEKSLAGSRHIFSDWNFFFSEPFHVGDSNFFYYVHLLLYLMIDNIVISYKIYIVIMLALSFFSMYILAHSLADKNRGLNALIAAFFYTLTPYFLFELASHQYMMWGYALLPLTYYFIYRALTNREGRTFSQICIAGIFIALSAFYPIIQYVYINGIFLALFSLLLCFKVAGRTQLKLVLHRIIRVFVMFSIALMLSAYFILPTLFLQSPYSVGFTFTRTLAFPIYSNTPIESTFLLNRGLRADIGLDYFSVYGALMMSFMLPIALSSFLIIIRRKDIHLIFFLLGILAVFFSMGSNAPPFLKLFDYARILPYFSIIRTPSRFTIQVAISFSLLGGIALGEIASKLQKIRPSSSGAKERNYKTMSLCLLIISIVIIPYLFSAYNIAYSVAGPFETQPIPDITYKVVKWLEKNDPNQDYRIIDLTRTHQAEAYHRSLARVEGDLVSRYYRSPSFARMLGLLNVKYIITEPDWGRPYFYWYAYINEVLSNSPYFDKVEIGNVTIYINRLAKPRIYDSYGALTLGGPNALSTFYALNEGARLVDTNTTWIDKTFESGWKVAELVNSQPTIFTDDWALFGTDVLNDGNNLDQIVKFNALVFHDSDLTDLTFLRLEPSFKFEAWKYLNGNWRVVEDHHGSLPSARSYQSSVFGQLVLSERAVYTDKASKLVIPINIGNVGSYDVYIRAKNDVPIDWSRWVNTFPVNSNVISVSIDGSTVGGADFGKVGGFKWMKANDEPLLLSEGRHEMALSTSGNPVYLDMIAVVPAGLIDSTIKKEMTRINDLQHIYLLEFSNYFAGENAYREASIAPYTSDAWSGYLTLKPNSTVTQKLFIAKNSSYVIGLRLLQRPDSGILTLKIDGTPILNAFRRGNNTWTWISSNPIFLSSGEHIIQVASEEGYNSVDLMYLIEASLMSNAKVEVGRVQYSEVQFNVWRGKLTFGKPTFLVFTESFYPEWVFQLKTENGQTSVKSLQAFWFLNAYHINSTGVAQFTIYHETSQVRKISYALSIATFIICCTIIMVENVFRGRRFAKFIREKGIEDLPIS